MTVVNWPEFEAKFGAGMQVAFERMAYLIFCKMHKEPYGLFRYRNHPATETVSVSFEGKVVGFQAKYWRSDLGCRLDDFKEAIDKVRKHDTRTNELVFFLPSDFNCNSQEKDDGLKTKTQRLVEQYAQSRGLALKWFCDSNFEVTFADEEYDSWGRHFFSREREGFDSTF